MNELDTTFRTGECNNKRVIEWISVDKALPENEMLVMATMTILYPRFKFLFYSNNSFYVSNSNYEDLRKWVTHWADISKLGPDND